MAHCRGTRSSSVLNWPYFHISCVCFGLYTSLCLPLSLSLPGKPRKPLPNEFKQEVEIHRLAKGTTTLETQEIMCQQRRGRCKNQTAFCAWLRIRKQNANCFQRYLSAVRGTIVSSLPPDQGDPGRERTTRQHKSLAAVASYYFFERTE